MKLFTTNAITKKELRKLICSVALSFGVKRVTFNNKSKYVAGTYNATSKIIYIDIKTHKKNMLHTFFHELAHHMAVKKKKWLKYHLNPACPTITSLKKFNIENGVDKIAEGMWNKHVDSKVWGKYKYGYPKSHQKQLVNWLNSMY